MTTEAWIVSGGRVLASAQIATNRTERRRGLLGRQTFDGAFVLPRCRWVHTLGMRFPIDIAFLDQDRRVIKTITVKPYRLCSPHRHAESVIEAQRGAFERWGLRVGDVIEIRFAEASDSNPGRGRS